MSRDSQHFLGASYTLPQPQSRFLKPSTHVLVGLLCSGFWSWAEFSKGPKWPVLSPFLKEGAAVSLRTVFTLGVVMASSSVLARVGTASQAAHEILRQLWICTYQVRPPLALPSRPFAFLRRTQPAHTPPPRAVCGGDQHQQPVARSDRPR